MLQTMEQQRAAYALKRLQPLIEADAKLRDELRAQANALPALIRINGLGQAMAFYKGKSVTPKGRAHQELYAIVSQWLCREPLGKVFAQADDILSAITTHDMQHYMAAQNEALALLEWVKKFAVALLAKQA